MDYGPSEEIAPTAQDLFLHLDLSTIDSATLATLREQEPAPPCSRLNYKHLGDQTVQTDTIRSNGLINRLNVNKLSVWEFYRTVQPILRTV